MPSVDLAKNNGLIIEQIEIMPIDIVPKRKRVLSTGPINYGDKGSWVGRPVLLRIRAGGIDGWGEVRPINPWVGETASSIFTNLRDFYAPHLIGKDAMQIERLLRECHARLPGNPAALAAIDFALHDVVGRALNVPAYVLLGGACKDKIPLEWSVGLADEKTMVEEAVMAVEKFGLKCICVKVGPASNIDFDVKSMSAIRKAIGDDVLLGMDANMGYDVVNAILLAKRLEHINLTYYEQPVVPRALQDLRRVYEECKGVSIIADESCYSPADATEVISARAADVLAIKFYKCGGMRRGREIATIADASYMRANCAGTANGSYIEALAGATLACAIPNHAFGAEFVMGLPSVDPDVLVKNRPIDVKDGYCNLPPGPGLGMEMDLEAVKRYQMDQAVVSKA